MLRIKLFALFIAFALLALVRPRKVMELLEAADAGAKVPENQPIEMERADFEDWYSVRYPEPINSRECARQWSAWIARSGGAYRARSGWKISREPWGPYEGVPSTQPAQECPLPPAGWRCTRQAGHDGPCATVVK